MLNPMLNIGLSLLNYNFCQQEQSEGLQAFSGCTDCMEEEDRQTLPGDGGDGSQLGCGQVEPVEEEKEVLC